MRAALFFFLGMSNVMLFAQSDTKADIDFYGDVMISAYDSLHRVKAGKEFKGLFEGHLQSTQMENDDLSWNKWVSVLYPEDRSFRVISWELRTGETTYEYFGYIQFADNRLIELKGGDEYWDQISYDDRAADDWPTALYYEIMKLDDQRYLLIGINRLNKFENVKIAEVLSLEGDQIQFGAPIFTDSDGSSKYRLVLKYADDAHVSINYNESLNLLIFDHLIPRMGRIAGQGVTMLPDGSYEAYELVNGKWQYVEKVFDHIYEEVPRPMPKTNKASKDIFGRDKKN